MKKNTSACFQALKANLPFDKRRVEFLAALLIGVIQQNTCNLARLANILDLSAKKESKYKRLQRFCRFAELDFMWFARLIIKIIAPTGKHILALDRTEWKYGAVWVNIITLSIVYGNSSFPILWQTLNRRANTTDAERKRIIERYIEVFGVDEIDYLSADREFDGYVFVEFLDAQKINFRLRIRVSMKITGSSGKKMEFKQILRNMKVGQFTKLRKARRYGSVKVYVEIEKGKDSKETVIVISSEKSRSIMLDYKKRWAIETLFQNLKGRGFEMEKTHMTKAERIDKLFGVLSLAVAWAIKTGDLESQDNPIEIKKNGRPQQSLFRLGCEIIQQILMEVKSYSKVKIFAILRC